MKHPGQSDTINAMGRALGLIDQRQQVEFTAFERCEDALAVAHADLLILRAA